MVSFLLSTWLCAHSGLAQTGATLQRAEQALCDGDDLGAERSLLKLLAEPGIERTARFEAWMLLAEIHYQRSAQEQFLAATDSAAKLLGLTNGQEQEAWARVETNRCRHAFFAMQYARAIELGESAIARYRRAADKSLWKCAFRIHQALAASYRISTPERKEKVFAHFDTALALIHARTDVLPYWEASIWRSLSNAAMDRMARSVPDHAMYGDRCELAQLHALRIMERNHPNNRLERAMLMNLHGLYLVYDGQPDGCMRWLERSQNLVADDVWRAHDERFIPTWLLTLRWKAFVYYGEPWRSDTTALKSYLAELQAAESLFTRFAAMQATAKGLFTRDRYDYAPLTSSAATCQRLWAITRDTRYIDQALHATEKARRDAWNIAQSLRGRPELRLPDPPVDMLAQLRQRMDPMEGLMYCMSYGLGQVGSRVITLTLTHDSVAFNECAFNYDWAWALDMPEPSDPARERRAFHSLYQALYAPVKHLLHDRVTRLRVMSTSELSKLSFDALIADTSSTDIRQCHPLVEEHAISYPYFLLPPEGEGHPIDSRNGIYLAPTTGSGELTDLVMLREAMARWHEGALPGQLDSSVTDATRAIQGMEGAGFLVWGGHCGGNLFMDDEPITSFSTSFTDSTTTLLPSQLLILREAPTFVVHAACQSGVFHPYGSSGSISFARAFLFAGSRTVVAAQHVADERSSIRLLEHLMDELADGQPPDLALQHAKLAYLREAVSAEDTRPLYWATWQVWGECAPLETGDPPRSLWPWLAGGALVVVAGGRAFRMRRRSFSV
ncbi:MAG: CHAT domain-containing protein [Flavobacteriales bacterium]|nr:CHAT domain-containing protein [Flavobacteriales bacterium]